MPDETAIVAGKQAISYGDFVAQAQCLAANLAPKLKSRRIGILGTRSIEAYLGIAAACWAGATYVPLNLKWPRERLLELMGNLKLDAIIVDANGARMVDEQVRRLARNTIILPILGEHDEFTTLADLDPVTMPLPAERDESDTAYIMFTSGTTGLPKGVVISNGSLATYLDQVRPWTNFTPQDRVCESCDITFDLSVHNMFLAFETGASLHLMSPLDMMAPQNFIRRNEVTATLLVPTVVNMMRRAGALKPNLFPSLRLSVFCGEPLPLTTAQDWADAAPNAVIENIYGPTEGTVVCTRQTLTDPPLITESRNILAIGKPFDSFRIAILDDNLKPVRGKKVGQIALHGPQLADGYFNASRQTDAQFKIIDGERWYLTGDLGYRDRKGVFHHMGRTDNQVKVKGNRIELEEVEMHFRRACQTDLAAIVAWPMVDGAAEGLVGFTTSDIRTPKAIQAIMERTLPRYMVPQRIEYRPELPLNPSGKTDRKALKAELEGERESITSAPGMETPEPATAKTDLKVTA